MNISIKTELELVWKILENRDKTVAKLEAERDSLMAECQEKEQQIQILATAAAERLKVIEELAQQIKELKQSHP